METRTELKWLDLASVQGSRGCREFSLLFWERSDNILVREESQRIELPHQKPTPNRDSADTQIEFPDAIQFWISNSRPVLHSRRSSLASVVDKVFDTNNKISLTQGWFLLRHNQSAGNRL